MAESMSIQAILSAVDSGFSSTMKNAQQAVSGLGSVSDQVTKQNKGFMSGMKSIASGIGVYKLASVGLNAVSNSMGGAIDRFDTMNRFPKMMEIMGYSAQDAQGSIDKLNQGVIGLPTALDTVVGTTQQLALMTGDLGQATDLTLALNNAFLASGASTGDASRGLTQFTQMLARGEPDLQSWRTLMETMPIALRQVSDSFGLPADNAYALYDALKSGDITFEEFTNRVIELSDATGGFADQAREASKGVRTSMENMGTAVVRGVEGMVSAFDDGLKSLTGKGISDWINTFSAGMSKGFKSAEKGMAGFFNFIERFKPAFSEIGRVAGSAFQAVGRFFQPVGTYIKEVGASLSVFSELLTTTIGQISRGDWAGAWDSLTSNISGRFRSLGVAFGNMVADMWSNLNELGANIGNFINNIDWGSVYDSIDGFFGTIGEQIMSVDWKLVGGEIGGSINELVGGVKNWLETNIPKVVEYTQTVLFNPQSELNIEAGEFHAQVMGLIDGFVEGLGIEEIIHDFVVEMNAKPMFSWGSWEDEISSAMAKMRRDILTVIQSIQNFGNELSQVQVNQDVVMDIMLKRGEGWDESQIETWIDENYDEGTYDTTIELVPTLEVTEPPVSYSDSIQAWADANATDLTIEQRVAVAIDAHISEGGTVGDLQHVIDQQFSEGTYQSTVKAELLIEILRSHGVDEGQIQSYINGQFGHNTYELIAQVGAIAEIVSIAGADESELKRLIDEQFGEGAYDHIVQVNAEAEVLLGKGFSTETIRQMINAQYGDKAYDIITKINPIFQLASSQPAMGGGGAISSALGGGISALVQSMAPKTPIAMKIPIAPQLVTGGAGGAEGDQSSGFDMSGIIAQITAQLGQIQTAVNTAMGTINATIATNSALWGTTISTAMTTMTTAVTTGMTAMSMAVMASLTSMSASVVASMTAMAASVASAMSSMASAVTSAMATMVQAVATGMQQAVAAAQSGAAGIVGAVSGLYGPMFVAGQSAGQGLAAGLNSMQGAVRAAASALASAANSAAQSAFVINSPSKVWRGFGYSAGEGLVDGFDGSQRSVKKSATRLAIAGLPSIAPFSGRSSHVSVSGNVSNAQQNEDLKSELSQIKKAINSGQVIMLDSGALVGGTVNQMDSALGEQITMGGRHSLA